MDTVKSPAVTKEQLSSLIHAAAKGDTEAFNALYEYSFSTVEHECLRVLHNPIDAEDAVQESYIIIYKKLGGIKDPEKFLSWCRTVAHNSSVNYIARRERKAGKDETRPPVSDENHIGMDQLDGEDLESTPEEKAEEELIRKYLQTALDNIAPAQAMCLALHQQGFTYDQIAEKLALPVGTVKSNVHYAKKALQKEIHRIEEKEHIQIHGFTLVPLAEKVVVQMGSSSNQKGSGFISAETPSSAAKDNIWNEVSTAISKTPSAQFPLWKKVVAIAVAVVVIVGGIIFAVNRAGHENFATQRNSSTSSQTIPGPGNRGQGQRPVAGTRANGAPALNPGAGNAAVPAGGANVTATQGVTATATARQAEPASTAPPATTREVFTNEARNMGNALAGN